jgi:uncharacterized protein (TIGR04255 family)
MGTPLKTPPVFLTIAQARFNPILKLSDFLADIQESFRQAGFPDFSSHRIASIQFLTQIGQPPAPTPVSQETFLFGNVERTQLFILDQCSLTLQSTDYDRFEAFTAHFRDGLRRVDDSVKLAFSERVGLRYLDRVMPQPGETIGQYLKEQVHGLASHIGGKSLYSYAESMNAVENIKLRSRVLIQPGGLTFPPDLPQPIGMNVPKRFTEYHGTSAVLDNDGFVEGREAFSVEAVASHLDTIHDVVSAAFKTTASEYAFDIWNK